VAVHANDVHAEIRACESTIARFNRWLGGKITNGVATMWAAYLFDIIALISLPAAIASGQVLVIVAWLAQTFLQLVLLAIILFGQNLAAEKADARAEATYRNTTDAEDALTALAKLQAEQMDMLAGIARIEKALKS
jgi:hypothetical protein